MLPRPLRTVKKIPTELRQAFVVSDLEFSLGWLIADVRLNMVLQTSLARHSRWPGGYRNKYPYFHWPLDKHHTTLELMGDPNPVEHI